MHKQNLNWAEHAGKQKVNGPLDILLVFYRVLVTEYYNRSCPSRVQYHNIIDFMRERGCELAGLDSVYLNWFHLIFFASIFNGHAGRASSTKCLVDWVTLFMSTSLVSLIASISTSQQNCVILNLLTWKIVLWCKEWWHTFTGTLRLAWRRNKIESVGGMKTEAVLFKCVYEMQITF